MTIVDAFLTGWLRWGRYPWSRVYRRLFEGRYRGTPLPVANSLDEIARALSQLTWVPDDWRRLFDSVSYPEATWARRRDDCDGFACLAAALLRRWQPETRPVLLTVIVRPAKDSHTVCVFAGARGHLRFFDNNTLRPEEYTSYADLAPDVRKSAERLVCWDIADPVTLKTIEFHRVKPAR